MDEAERIKRKYACRYSSPHYDFYYSQHSPAERDIVEIARRQEACYRTITQELHIYPPFRLIYLLAETPRDAGILYGDNEPCNGFARSPNLICAVYNEKVKCIGMHEDAHIISYSLKKPASAFLSEGLAMYFDASWQGRGNEELCREFCMNGVLPEISELFENDRFFALPEEISYPIAGAFTRFLMETAGTERYLTEIYFNDGTPASAENLFGGGENMQSEFIKWLTDG